MKSLLLINWCLLVHCYHQHSVSKGAHVLVLLYIGIFYLVLIKMMKDCSRYTIYFALIMYVLTRLLPFSWLWIDTCQLLRIACFHSLFMLLVKLDIWLNKMDPPWYACGRNSEGKDLLLYDVSDGPLHQKCFWVLVIVETCFIRSRKWNIFNIFTINY